MQQFSVRPKTRGMLLMEIQLGRPLEEFLQERYVDNGLTTQAIADELGVNNGTVSRWMAQLGIEVRYFGRRRKVA